LKAGGEVLDPDHSRVSGQASREPRLLPDLPKISRPGCGKQQATGVLIHHNRVHIAFPIFEEFGAGLGQVGPEEWQNLIATFSEWRELNPESPEAVEQVLPKVPKFNLGFEIGVGRRNDTHREMPFARLPNPGNRSTIEYAKEGGLDGGGRLGEFIQKKGSGMGLFDQATTVAVGTGERALRVSKKGGLLKSVHHCG
jgi:hypothetical protein